MTDPTDNPAPPTMSVRSFPVCFGAACFGYLLVFIAIYGLRYESQKPPPRLKDGAECPPWLADLYAVHGRRQFALMAILYAVAILAACGTLVAVFWLTAWPWYVGHPIFGLACWAVFALPPSCLYRPAYDFLVARLPAPNLIVPTADAGAGSGLTMDPSAAPSRLPARFRFRTVQRRGLVREILDRRTEVPHHTDFLAESAAQEWTETLSAYELRSVPAPAEQCLIRLRAVDGEAWACEFCD